MPTARTASAAALPAALALVAAMTGCTARVVEISTRLALGTCDEYPDDVGCSPRSAAPQ
ncbi:hypothetical protein [Agromyces seonyuensis]|uniref:Lipoprotein n=1 Tax=Agromyces seonyuensis TaxID=2662446 RepID=A0A6I4P6P9_9MICO|nr:hypothetical protein [Agromyces seonyuensis]MWB99334.1 hypothetical protein [Agromyces seonyuensis]